MAVTLPPSMVVVVGQESKPYACSTHVRPCAIYTRAGERGRTGLRPIPPRQKSVGRETFHSCPPAMGERDGSMRPARSRTGPHRACGRHEGESRFRPRGWKALPALHVRGAGRRERNGWPRAIRLVSPVPGAPRTARTVTKRLPLPRRRRASRARYRHWPTPSRSSQREKLMAFHLHRIALQSH